MAAEIHCVLVSSHFACAGAFIISLTISRLAGYDWSESGHKPAEICKYLELLVSSYISANHSGDGTKKAGHKPAEICKYFGCLTVCSSGIQDC